MQPEPRFWTLARIAEQSPCRKSRLVALRWMARIVVCQRALMLAEQNRCRRAGLPLPGHVKPVLDSAGYVLVALGRQLADLDDQPLDVLDELPLREAVAAAQQFDRCDRAIGTPRPVLH